MSEIKKPGSKNKDNETLSFQAEQDALKKKNALREILSFVFIIAVALVLVTFGRGGIYGDPSKISNSIISSLKDKYGGVWNVELDEISKIPKNVIVPSLKVAAYSQNASKVDKENAFEVSKEFIAKNSDSLKIDANNLKEAVIWDGATSKDPNRKFLIAHMQQTYKGIPVSGGIVSTIFRNDELISYSSSWQPYITLSSVTPNITAEEAFKIAKTLELSQSKDGTTPLDERDVKLHSSKLLIFPVVNGDSNTYKLAWELTFEDIIRPPLALVYYIDAKTSALIKRENRISHAIQGYVLGGMYPKTPTDGRESNIDFPGYVVRAVDEYGNIVVQAVTDDAGFYSLNTLDGRTYRLEFSFFNSTQDKTIFVVGNSENGGDAYAEIDIISPDVYWFNWDDEDTTYKKEASNVFYHIRKIKDFFNDPLRGAPFDIPELYITAIIGDQEACTARSSSYTLTFGRSSDKCEATSLSSQIIYHEFAHRVNNYIYYPDPLSVTDQFSEELMLNEAFSDYWGASISDDPAIGRGIFPSPFRNLQNTLRYPPKEPPLDENQEYGHYNSQILSGALWDFRTKMIEVYGIDLGIQMTDERVLLAIKQMPRTIEDVLYSLAIADDDFGSVYDGTPHLQLICEAFNDNHSIWHLVCDVLDIEAPQLNFNDWGIPAEGTFIPSFPSLFPLIGSASAPDEQTQFQNYDIQYKQFGRQDWGAAGITLKDGGLQQVVAAQLGTIDQSQLAPGCFYEAQLNVQTSAGTTQTNVVFQKLAGSQPTMPRMVCIYRTANQGSDNDACEVIALVSDPKPAYYTMPADDWRRGRDWKIIPGAEGDGQIESNGMCDPDFADGNCADDCWNITGEKGNRTTGNNGLNDIFCKAGSGCSPVSFSGCPSDDNTCIDNAVAGIKDVYHKVVFLHWSNKDLELKNCSDDDGFQKYMKTPGWARMVGQCSYPRCEKVFMGDVLDGFDTLVDRVGGPDQYLIFREGENRDFVPQPRVFETPATKCATCGCSSDSPYCNAAADTCEQKCWDGQPFDTCKPAVVNGVAAANYCKAEDFNTYQTKYACGSLCPSAQCPTVNNSYGVPQKLVCNTNIGYCVACRSDADCTDSSGCTIGKCNNPGEVTSSCTFTRAFPNDCPATQECGLSPSGCYSCGSGCPTGKMCGANNTCVRDLDYKCNPLKEKCDLTPRGPRPMN